MTPLLQKVAAFGIPGHDVRFPEQPLLEEEWARFLAAVGEQRLAGYLHAAIDVGLFPVEDGQRDAAEALHLQWCNTALRIERRLLDLDQYFAANNIEFVVLKGTAVAHLVYPDPALRLFGDADLLFRSEQFDRALEVLVDVGYERPAVEPRPGFDRRFGKGATLRRSDGAELDAHRNLIFGTFGFAISLDELFDSAVTFDLGGRHLLALGPETRLLHACYHAALGDPRPRYSSVRDVAQMLTTGAHDPDHVIELADQWQARAVLARAFQLCRGFLGVPVAGPVAEAVRSHQPSRRERRAIESYVGENRAFAIKVVASLPYIRGVRAKAGFLTSVAFPSRGYAETRGGESGVAWLRRGLKSLRGRGRS